MNRVGLIAIAVVLWTFTGLGVLSWQNVPFLCAAPAFVGETAVQTEASAAACLRLEEETNAAQASATAAERNNWLIIWPIGFVIAGAMAMYSVRKAKAARLPD